MMSLVDLELALNMIERDLERLEKAARALEANGNLQAAYDARSWKIAMGRLYIDLRSLIESIEEERLLEASELACILASRIYTLINAASNDKYLFVSRPSRGILASLLTLTSGYCSKG